MPWNKYRFKKKESPKAPLSKEEEEKEKKKNKPLPEPGQKFAGGGRATHGYGKAYMKGGRVK
jgi:hypothetical protein